MLKIELPKYCIRVEDGRTDSLTTREFKDFDSLVKYFKRNKEKCRRIYLPEDEVSRDKRIFGFTVKEFEQYLKDNQYKVYRENKGYETI